MRLNVLEPYDDARRRRAKAENPAEKPWATMPDETATGVPLVGAAEVVGAGKGACAARDQTSCFPRTRRLPTCAEVFPRRCGTAVVGRCVGRGLGRPVGGKLGRAVLGALDDGSTLGAGAGTADGRDVVGS